MKMKFIAVLICVMLMTTLLAVAKPPQKIGNISSTETMFSAYDAEVPVLEVGDKWTYQIDNISLLYQQEGKLINIYLTIAELPLTVISTTGDFYTLELQTSAYGQAKIDTDLGDGPVNMTITFSNLEISGNVLLEKSTLGIKEISVAFNKGKFTVNVINQPYIVLPGWLQKISAKMTMNMTTTLVTPFSLLTFPLSTGIFWNSTSTSFALNGKIQSPWLSFINFLNNIGKLLGREFLPPEVAALLPIIDMNEALTTLGSGNVFQIPAIPNAFICLNTENIIVPAGTYDAYNITLIGGMAQCFYAPTAGNVIKISGNLGEIIPYITNINMELLSTNYS
jgi:hypothetical protein